MMTFGRPDTGVSTHAGRRQAQGHAARRLLPLAALALALTAAPATLAFLQVPDEQSPATGTAQVVAQGVVTIPEGDLRWEVNERNAPPPANASSTATGLGFLVVTGGVLLIEDGQTGEQARLAAGEAILLEPGANQTRVALGSEQAVYDELSLVAATTEASQDPAPRYASEPFAGSGNRHDLDLLQDDLGAGAQMVIPDGALPSLVLVREGGAQVATEAGDVVSLGRGEAVALDGQLVVTATESGAGIAATYAGAAVPALAQVAAADTAPAATATSGRVIETAESATAAAGQPAATPPAAAPAGAEDDEDGDGLSAARETEAGTDPTLADTDGDGLNDGREVLEVRTNPLDPDSDRDGALDGDEVAIGTNPLDALGPATPETIVVTGTEETPVAGDPAAVEAAVPGDGDGDGLEDAIEFELGTDPFDIDTDDDGATDGDEYYVHQTGTRNPDSDGDGVLDGDEAANGTNPNDPTSF